MIDPIRIQRKRTKDWRKPPNTVYVGRPTEWGNPYGGGDNAYFYFLLAYADYISPTDELALRLNDSYVVTTWEFHGNFASCVRRAQGLPSLGAIEAELSGRNLMCWCPLDQPCHADVLLELANG